MINKLCIIDDDDLYKLLLKKTVSRLGLNIEIKTYANGEEAFKELLKLKGSSTELPDIILLDINMPVMDGWEFMEQFVNIKDQLAKPITIYIASSSIAKHDIEKSKTYSEISGYIIKPILKETVINLIHSKKAV